MISTLGSAGSSTTAANSALGVGWPTAAVANRAVASAIRKMHDPRLGPNRLLQVVWKKIFISFVTVSLSLITGRRVQIPATIGGAGERSLPPAPQHGGKAVHSGLVLWITS